MKKIMLFAAVAASMLFTACGGGNKTAKLETQEDSLTYLVGAYNMYQQMGGPENLNTVLLQMGSDSAFVKDMLLAMANNWTSSTVDVSLKALLPEEKRAELDAVMQQSAEQLAKAGVEVGYSKDVKSGFKLGEKSGGYYISFSDESFEALLSNYLRDKVSQLLFKA